MNNSINHKFHHISRAEYQELLAVSRGDAVLRDPLIISPKRNHV